MDQIELFKQLVENVMNRAHDRLKFTHVPEMRVTIIKDMNFELAELKKTLGIVNIDGSNLPLIK